MKVITKIQATKLARGLKEILQDARQNGVTGGFPIAHFEQMIMVRHAVPLSEAERVVEAIIDTGIVQWNMGSNNFVLTEIDHA